jgi:hypothetical protein
MPTVRRCSGKRSGARRGQLFSRFLDARHNERRPPRAACGGAVLGIHRGGSGHAAISQPQKLVVVAFAFAAIAFTGNLNYSKAGYARGPCRTARSGRSCWANLALWSWLVAPAGKDGHSDGECLPSHHPHGKRPSLCVFRPVQALLRSWSRTHVKKVNNGTASTNLYHKGSQGGPDARFPRGQAIPVALRNASIGRLEAAAHSDSLTGDID